MALTQQERADLDALAELEKRPTAGQRVARSGGQLVSGYVILDAAVAFDWFGAADWTEDQTKAAYGLATFAVVTVMNYGPALVRSVADWVRTRRAG